MFFSAVNTPIAVPNTAMIIENTILGMIYSLLDSTEFIICNEKIVSLTFVTNSTYMKDQNRVSLISES